MSLKKAIMLVFVAMITFLFVSKPVMNESVVHAASSERIMYDDNNSGEPNPEEELGCKDMFDEGLDDMLDQAYTAVRIIAVALTIVLGMLDFAKAIWSNDQDGLKKAQQKFVKRLVAMVVIIILPFIIDPIVEMALGKGYNTCEVGE